MDHFNQDGRGLFNYLWVFGYKTPTTKQLQKKEAVWKDATVATVCIPIDEDTPQSWKEWCMDHGRRLGKPLSEIRTKYLEGFPDQFDVVVVPERSSLANGGAGNYVHPATYPAHYPVHLAGNAHPNAGEPDMDTLAQFLSGVWIDMVLHGKIRPPPKGSVLMVDSGAGPSQCFDTSDPVNMVSVPDLANTQAIDISPFEGALPDSTRGGLFLAYQIVPMVDNTTGRVRNHVFAVKRDSIGPKTLCFACGGRGHVARVDGIPCSTLELGVDVPKPLSSQTGGMRYQR